MHTGLLAKHAFNYVFFYGFCTIRTVDKVRFNPEKERGGKD